MSDVSWKFFSVKLHVQLENIKFFQKTSPSMQQEDSRKCKWWKTNCRHFIENQKKEEKEKILFLHVHVIFISYCDSNSCIKIYQYFISQ